MGWLAAFYFISKLWRRFKERKSGPVKEDLDSPAPH